MTTFDARLRAAAFVDWVRQGEISPATTKAALISLILEAEDAGGERAASIPPVDSHSRAALRDMVREGLDPLLGKRATTLDLEDLADSIVKTVITEFDLRLKFGDEPTQPQAVPFAEEVTR